MKVKTDNLQYKIIGNLVKKDDLLDDNTLSLYINLLNLKQYLKRPYFLAAQAL